MEKQFSNYWYMPLFKGIMMILIAVLMLMSPAGAMMAWSIYIGIGFIISGVFIIYSGIKLKEVIDNWGWKVFEGIIDIFLGFMLIANPIVTVAALPLLFGFWGAIYGIYIFIDAFAAKRDRVSKILFGILIFLISTTIMFNPITAALSMVIWFSLLLIVIGISSIVIAFKIKKIN